jgi:hypothetical protein
MNNANKFMFFNIKIKKTISQELFLLVNRTGTLTLNKNNLQENKRDLCDLHFCLIEFLYIKNFGYCLILWMIKTIIDR